MDVPGGTFSAATWRGAPAGAGAGGGGVYMAGDTITVQAPDPSTAALVASLLVDRKRTRLNAFMGA